MHWPCARSRTARYVALAAMVAIPFIPAAAFDDEPREVTLGAFGASESPGGPGEIASPQPRWWPEPRKGAATESADERDAGTLLADALDDLAHGEPASAQRLFEQVIALAPESRQAFEARRHLAALYSGEAGGHGPAVPRMTTRASEPPSTDGAVAAARAPSAASVRPPAGGSPRLPEALEMQFIEEAGDRVFFSAGSAELGTRAKRVLAAQARWLGAHPDADVLILGFSDDDPLTPDQQARLAAERGEAVRRALEAEGVAPDRVSIQAAPGQGPIAICREPQCAAQNRRAVVTLVPAPRDQRSALRLGMPRVSGD